MRPETLPVRSLLIPVILSALLLGACGLPRGKEAAPSDMISGKIPALWREAAGGQHDKISTGWLPDFQDPQLTALVHEAIAENNDLRAAAHRLEATRENNIRARARSLPQVTAGTTSNRRLNGSESSGGSSASSYGISFAASWEIDVWGRLRDSENADKADYRAAIADYRGARLSLAINTAKAWINLTEAQQQVELAEKTLQDFKKSLSLISRRHREALLRAVDVQFGRNNVASAERNLRSQVLRRDEAARTLELLLGRYPAGELEATPNLPTLRRQVPAGLPSALLARRPDLASGRERIYATARRADTARKSLLPSLRLTGSGGNGSPDLRRALDPSFLTWSIASSLAQTLYQGGAPSAAARAALELNKAAIYEYLQDALQALREVESALQVDLSLREQESFLLIEVDQASKAQAAAERDLGLGIEGSSVLEILVSQRRAVNARGSLIRLRNQRLQNRLSLHLALGGDYETSEEN